MKKVNELLLYTVFLTLLSTHTLFAQTQKEAKKAMLDATKYMVENVSTNGGYVWYYTPDLSRRWGEMEAYKTMVWVQDGGTVSMGQTFLDAYNTTGNQYYYQAAERAAAALIWGQSAEGGWNYMIDFGGDRSLKKWYSTIGKNGWRLEEFQHYYGNDTYDDDVTSAAAKFILRMYVQKLDPKYKPALDKAVNLVLRSQYPTGGWPQRYPLKYDFGKNGNPDYSSYYTYNDDVIGENINFLILCYQTLGEERFLDPILRGMNFFIISQQENGAWGQQYNMQLEPAGARTYEPAALDPRTTFSNAMLLMKFYEYTGDRRFLAGIPRAIQWLEKVRLPAEMTENGKFTHSTFVDLKTDKPVFVHRKGSNVAFGSYYIDSSDQKLLGHYGGKQNVNIEKLKQEYERLSALSPNEATKDSPLKPEYFQAEDTPQQYFTSVRNSSTLKPDKANVKEIIKSLDSNNRWLVKHAMISNPYMGEGQNQDLTPEYASTHVGDESDTSPYRDLSDKEYISTVAYIRNMNMLMEYISALSE